MHEHTHAEYGAIPMQAGAHNDQKMLVDEHLSTLWPHFVNLMLGLWLIMIPYALDELVAMGQFLLAARRKGESLWRVFWMGGAMGGGSEDHAKEFRGSYSTMLAETVAGVTLPWTLLASAVLGIWLMFTRLTFDTSGGRWPTATI